MNKIEENNKKELEKPLEENLDSEEECTFKEKAYRLIKKPIIYIPARIVALLVLGYFAKLAKPKIQTIYNKIKNFPGRADQFFDYLKITSGTFTMYSVEEESRFKNPYEFSWKNKLLNRNE